MQNRANHKSITKISHSLNYGGAEMIDDVICAGIGGGHGGQNNNDAGGILSNRLSLPLPLTACHRCDVCGKLLSTKLTLKRHKEQQHLQPLNNAVCNLCHKVFRTLNSLNNHKSIYHRRQKHHLYSAHPTAQNMQPHHLSQLPQQNAAKLDFI